MRRLTLGIAGSAVVHVVALVGAPHDDRTASAAVEPPRVELIDVELPSPPPFVTPPATPPSVNTLAAPSVIAIARSAPRVDTTVVPDAAVRAPTPTGLLSMRMRGAIDLRMPAIGIDLPGVVAPGDLHIAERPGAAKSPETRDDNFSIHVDENGTAHVTRKSDNTAHITAPTIDDIGQGFADWWNVEKFSDEDYLTLSGDKIAEKHGVHVIATPSGGFNAPPGGGDLPFLIPVFGGNFDLSHVAMRGHGDDPYAAHKQQMLDATRDERAAALEQQRRAKLADAARVMTANLARMWAATPDPARHQALFEMWDECAETGDDAAIAAGAAARTAVIRFIHDRAVVFAPSEIEDLNRGRHSTARFDPR